jgi:asparagine synthase (glutamine-hydrolysing)
MAFSTELREPFLDYLMVEFAFAQPEHFKLQNGQTKFVLREILGDLVTNKVVHAPKRVLQTPQREWLGNELKHLVNDTFGQLRSSDFKHWFDFDAVEKEWKGIKTGNKHLLSTCGSR